MRRELWWIAVLAVAMMAGGAWWLLRGYHHTVAPAVPTPPIANDVQVRLSNVHLHGISNGKVVWEVVADNFDLAKNRPVLHIHGLKEVSVVQGGKQELTVSADTVEQNTTTGDITLNGNVNVAGHDLAMRTQTVIWEALHGVLFFPEQFSAQFGDFTLMVGGNTRFDARNNQLYCDGNVLLATQGNTIRAGSAQVDIQQGDVTLKNAVQADFAVADVEDWAAGKHLPQLPSISPAVIQRYREYCQRQGLPVPGAPPPSVIKGFSLPRKGGRP